MLGADPEVVVVIAAVLFKVLVLKGSKLPLPLALL